jgi:pimeloyl-ACP methyl ester carboxylesterase
MPGVTHRMIETNGIRLHVAEQGEGPLVILCHGFPECWYLLRTVASPIAAQVWRHRTESSIRQRRELMPPGIWRSIRYSMTSATSWVSSML